MGHFQTITRRKLSEVPEVLRTKAPLTGSPKRAEREALAAALLLYEDANCQIVDYLSWAERQVYRHMRKMLAAKTDKMTGYFSLNRDDIPDSHKNKGSIMSQKTFSDNLHHQTRRALNCLSQKLPGTVNYTPKDLARDVLVALLKPGEAYELFDPNRNGYELAGPNGPGIYVNDVRTTSVEK